MRLIRRKDQISLPGTGSMGLSENTEKSRKKRNDMHLARRIFHMSGGVVVAWYAMLAESKNSVIYFLAGFFLLVLLLEFARLRFEPARKMILGLMGGVMREEEEVRLSGVPYYALGCLFTFIVFPRSVAILAVLFLAFGDSTASLVGSYMKKRRHHLWKEGKTFAGSLACFCVCSFLTGVFMPIIFSDQSFGALILLLSAVVGGLSATIAEALPLRTDDNLSLPLISGAFFWLYASFLGFVPGLIA